MLREELIASPAVRNGSLQVFDDKDIKDLFREETEGQEVSTAILEDFRWQEGIGIQKYIPANLGVVGRPLGRKDTRQRTTPGRSTRKYRSNAARQRAYRQRKRYTKKSPFVK